jgi:hypothetical protein
MIIIFWEMTPCGSYHSHRRGNLKSYNVYVLFVRRDAQGKAGSHCRLSQADLST